MTLLEEIMDEVAREEYRSAWIKAEHETMGWDKGVDPSNAEPVVLICSTCKKEPCECPSINRGSFAKYVESTKEPKQ